MAEYYVLRNKNTGLYFRGKGVNRWGKYYNQASVYRIKKNAENAIKEVAWKGEQAEIVPIQIFDATADVAPRAEVEELVYKLESLLCHATGGKLSKHTYDLLTMETAVTDYLDESYCEGKEEGYKNAKSEVAREIFEELDKKIFHHIPDLYTFEIYTELKKKYTGESQ